MTINELNAYRNDLVNLRDRLDSKWHNAPSSSDSLEISREDFFKCFESVSRCVAFLEELDIELPDISEHMPGK